MTERATRPPPRSSTPISWPTALATGSRCSAPCRLSAIIELYLASDVFVLASRFEGYGMALAEAIAHGLPVVSTRAGAIPDTVPAGTGLLVPPDDVAALAQALRRLISDRAERRRLAMNARAAAAQLPTWQDSARLFAGAIETVD